MLRFWVGTVPLPSESPLGITPGSGAAGAQSRPGSGRMLEAVGRSSGCGHCAQFGASAMPLAGQCMGRAAFGQEQCHSGWFWFQSNVCRLGTGRSWCLSGSGCLCPWTSAAPYAADVVVCVVVWVRYWHGPNCLSSWSHKATYHVLLWAKKLCVQVNRLFSP